MQYSIVVPVYNEFGNITSLDSEIKNVMNGFSRSYEIIYVNDGSSDKSLLELNSLKNVKIVNLNRNYGQSTALDTGFKEAKGELVVSIDGDGQNDPRDIPRLVKKLKWKNLDVVTGWRKKRKDKSGIKIMTKLSKFIRGMLIKDTVHDSGCTLRVYKKRAVKSLDLQGEMHRYVVSLLRWKGFRVGELIVRHRPRRRGKSKYSYEKMLKGFVDLIYVWFILKFSQRPLHIFGILGMLLGGLGALIEVWVLYGKIFQGQDLGTNAWFEFGFFLMIGGLIFFCFGITLDLVIKIYHNTSPNENRYYIREVIKK